VEVEEVLERLERREMDRDQLVDPVATDAPMKLQELFMVVAAAAAVLLRVVMVGVVAAERVGRGRTAVSV
jgi:hypothetical protein